MKELENEFTWSASRHNTFQYCKRQYWWTYYGAWGGWNREGDPEARQAYVLKNLSNRWAWVGTVVHETIEGLLRRTLERAQDGMLVFETGGLDLEAELDAVTVRMRRDWVQSRDGEYHFDPKRRCGLAEHEYREDVPREEWRAMNQKARDAVQAFLTSKLFEELDNSETTRWLPIEQLDQFVFEGTPIWVVMDFARHTADDGIEIYDWKTGAVDPEGNKPQLGCYTMYVGEKHGVPPERVQNALVYLGTSIDVVTFRLTEDDLGATRAFIRESIGMMRARLRDKAANVAVRDDFALTDDVEKCATCVYRRLCGRQ